MGEEKNIKDELKTLFELKKFAVLSTSDNHQPYVNLVAFVESPELDWILFATERSTRKFQNLIVNQRVSLMIENSSDKASDVQEAVAVTIIGKAEILGEPEKKNLLSAYLQKHPYLEDFIASDSCALVKVNVDQFVVVQDFQRVSTLNVR